MSTSRRYEKEPFIPAFDLEIKSISQFTGRTFYGSIGVGPLELFARFKHLQDGRISTLRDIRSEKISILDFIQQTFAENIANEKTMHINCFYDLIEIIENPSQTFLILLLY
jgi:hypothetical protein